MNAASTQIRWTEFPNLFASKMTTHSGSWPELLQLIRRAGPYPRKGDAPLCKLATFGYQRSKKGSLRHDANLDLVYGLEADYDAGIVPMQMALERLERYGIRAAFYPTASSTPAKPRWRCFAPLATAAAPSERARLIAQVNGALGGIVSRESFTPSQSFYFGSITNAAEPYQVVPTLGDPDAGACVDQLPGLDAIAVDIAVPSSLASATEEARRTSEVILPLSSVPPPSSSVGISLSTLPRDAGERNACLFRLARMIKQHHPNSTRDELRDFVMRWHELALPAILTKDFTVTFEDFMRGFEKVRQPFGAVLAAALANYKDSPLPPGMTALRYGDVANDLVRVCSALQAHHGEEPFFLSARQAGALMGVHFTDASKLLSALVRDGVIALVSQGSGRKASRYRFSWGAKM